jgi:hypothetical protein
VSDAAVASARVDWAEGRRRFDHDVRDRQRAEPLHRQLEAVAGEIRRRLGDAYTLAELAAVYADSEQWARVAVGGGAAADGSGESLAFVVDAAFQLASTNAIDYVP